MLSVGGTVLIGGSISGSASAAAFQALGAGQVVTSTSLDAKTTAPVDGQLRTPDAQASVTGVAWPSSANGQMATDGHRLVAFTVTLSEPVTSTNSGNPSPAKLSLVVNGSKTSLDLSSITVSIQGTASGTGSGTESYVASVPNTTRNVELEMAQAGFVQDLSLWTLKRTTSAPASLYASSSASSVVDTIGLTEQIPVTNPSTGVTWNSVVQIKSASLEAFDPGGSGAVAPKNQSYLVLDMTSTPIQRQQDDPNYGSFYAAMTPLSGSDIVLIDSAGRTFMATQSNPGDPGSIFDETTNDNLLNATYSFLVPDSFTGGTASIGATTTNGSVFTYFTGHDATSLNVGGPTTFPVNFPAPPKASSQPTPPWVGQPNPATLAASSGGGLPPTSSSSGGGLPVWLAAVIVAMVAGGAELYRRSRNRSKDAVDDGAAEAAEGAVEEEASGDPTPASDPTSGSDQPQDPTVGSDGGDDPAILRVEIMGAVRVSPVTAPADEFTRAFISYLAVHNDRPRTVDDTQTALWPLNGTERDISRKTFLNKVSDARRIVRSQHLPGKVEQSGYRLVDVTCDWAEFQVLAAMVAQADTEEAIELRDQALQLVRGVPFESDVSPWFNWADSEGLRTAIETSVVSMARDQARALVGLEELDGAEAALRQGLRVNPTEMILWEELGRVVLAGADPNVASRFWRDISAGLDPGSVSAIRGRLEG